MMRAAVSVAVSVLVVLGITYYLTYEPAPQIRVVWRNGIAPERRAELERRFLLVNGATFRDRVRYDLLDTRRENIEALVKAPDVADTDGVRRASFSLPVDLSYGQSWMWVRYRIPVLRIRGVVEGIVVACALVLGIAARELLTARRHRTPVERTL